jgi:broad specificity phosphatase PhoE
MPTIYLVRHGHAAAGFDAHRNPGLDDVGRQQAQATAKRLNAQLDRRLPIYSSPLARARQTADALAALWQAQVSSAPQVAEIPSPSTDLRERAAWLRGVMASRWSEQPQELLAWRRDMLDWVLGLPSDAVVFSHFVAINVIAGAAAGDDAVIVFRPDYASVTRIGTAGDALKLLGFGAEADTRVN